MKDGGVESHVAGLFFCEIKSLFSAVILHFFDGSREAFHTHAFNSISWVLKGKLTERLISGKTITYTPSVKPVITLRSTFHKVSSSGDSWVLSLRGPWVKIWNEYLPKYNKFITLTNGRKVV